ncbi:MAG: ribonuclease Z [Candidatus Cryptobacteroides sp.]
MNFTLNVLGTASALPTTERNPSAQVLDVHGRLFMIDCGEGTQMQMRRTGLSFLKIEHICLSHIHGDHVFGIFGLLSTMGMLGRTAGLTICAPKSFGPILKFFLSYFGEGIRFNIDFVPLEMKEPAMIYENKVMEVLAFPLKHRIDTFGFIFREKMPPLNVRKDALEKYSFTLGEIGALKRGEDVFRPAGSDAAPSVENGFRPCSGTDEPLIIRNCEAAYRPYQPRSYAYCSDTAPFPELSLWVKGVTLLYHEATFPDSMSEMAEKTYHSTTVQAAECALKAGVGRLLVGHYSSRFPDVGFYLDEIRSVFPDAELARDCTRYDLPLERTAR